MNWRGLILHHLGNNNSSGIEVWLFGTNAWQCRMVVHITIFVLHSAIR